MAKSDKSKHHISIASIKRTTIKPYDFKWTRFYENNSDFNYRGLLLNLSETELIICSTVIDADNYSILTTQQLITKQNGQESAGNIQGANSQYYFDFKGYKVKGFTTGQVQLLNGTTLNYFVETGRASMIMINGIKTIIAMH